LAKISSQPDCPRCKVALKTGGLDYFCPESHGVLMTLEGLQDETSRVFARWIFSAWFRFKNKRSISCPACKTKMIQVHVQDKRDFELDCCPFCFAIWLDSGEDYRLKELFYKRTQLEQLRDLTSEENQILGKIVLEHEETKERFRKIEALGNQLSKRIYGFSCRFWF